MALNGFIWLGKLWALRDGVVMWDVIPYLISSDVL